MPPPRLQTLQQTLPCAFPEDEKAPWKTAYLSQQETAATETTTWSDVNGDTESKVKIFPTKCIPNYPEIPCHGLTTELLIIAAFLLLALSMRPQTHRNKALKGPSTLCHTF